MNDNPVVFTMEEATYASLGFDPTVINTTQEDYSTHKKIKNPNCYKDNAALPPLPLLKEIDSLYT